MSLDRFTESTRPDPPQVRRRRFVRSPTKDKLAGFIGVETNRGSTATVYTTLRRGHHFYSKGMGYAISDSILARCERHGVARIFVHEGAEPDDDVHEFSAADYYNGTPVPASDLETERDPQTYVHIDEQLHEWSNFARALFTQSFERACERIGRHNG